MKMLPACMFGSAAYVTKDPFPVEELGNERHVHGEMLAQPVKHPLYDAASGLVAIRLLDAQQLC